MQCKDGSLAELQLRTYWHERGGGGEMQIKAEFQPAGLGLAVHGNIHMNIHMNIQMHN